MRSSVRWALGLTALLGLVALPFSAQAKADKGRTTLFRSATSVDPDVKGTVKVRSKTDDQRVVVQVRNASPASIHDLWIEDGGATMVFVAPLEGAGSYLKYKARLKKGQGTLPLGAASVAELAGRRIEVRIGAAVELTAMLPGTTPGPDVKGEADLTPTAFAPAGSDAKIELRSRPRKGDERFQVDVKDLNLANGAELRLFLEDPAAAGVLTDQGVLVPHDGGDEHRFRRRAKDGDPLPFSVATTTDLVGLALEILDTGSGNVIFDGAVPTLD